ncbi:MAG: gerKB2 [Symbiobacteriaceae bacterium]|nr:gerKB2 [Symbiobacteriaceae bacterium]
MNTVRISSQQFACLLGLFNCIAALIFMPAVLAKVAGPDAWLSVPLSMLMGAVPVSGLLALLVRRHPGQSFFQVAEACLGRWPGRLAVLSLGLFSLFLTSLVIRDVVDQSAIALLPGTPRMVIAILFAGATAYAANAGSEVTARLAVLAFLLAVFTVAFMALGLQGEIVWTRIRPLLGEGFLPVLRGAWPVTGWFAQFIALAPFVFQISRPEKALRGMLWGNLFATGLLVALVLSTILTFSAPLTEKLFYPTYSLARQVAIGQFLERLEIGLMTVWLSGMLVKAAASLWSAAACLRAGLGLPHAWWLTVIITAIAVALSAIWSSPMALAQFSTKVWTPLTIGYDLGLPLLLLLGSYLRVRRRKGVSA